MIPIGLKYVNSQKAQQRHWQQWGLTPILQHLKQSQGSGQGLT